MPGNDDGIGHANGNVAASNGEGDQPKLRRSAFRALVQDFSPLWYISLSKNDCIV